MNFPKFWRSSKKKASSRDLDFELFSQLSYMSAIAATGVERSRIFEHASQAPCATASYFKEVHLLAQRLNYDYSEACRIVGESTAEEEVKSLLLRLSAALSSGEKEDEYLAREAQVQAEVYSNKYERDLESLSRWTDAFTALIMSTTLIVVITLISSTIFAPGANVTLFITVMMGVMIAVSLLGAWFIYHIAPHEVRFHSSPQVSPELRLSSKVFKALLPAAIALGVVMAVLRVDAWIIILACGSIVFPIGVVSLISDRRVDSKDKEIGTFFRSLGGVTSAVGMSVKEGLDKLDMRSMPSLLPDVKRLHQRLVLGLKPDVCWQRFSAETGSETARRSTETFYQATNLGGEADKVGWHTSFFATTLSLLRARRKLVSGTFRWLCIGMHALAVALLVFIVEMVCFFAQQVEALQEEMMEAGGAYVAEITGGIFVFNFAVAESFRVLIIPVALVLSLVSAFALQATEGGHRYKFFLYLGSTLALSGMVLGGMQPLVEWIFRVVEV